MKAMSQSSWKTELKPLVGPILVPLVFFWRELLGLTAFAGFDFTHLILPFQQFARDCLSSGRLPEWNPCLFAGFPQLAEGEGGLFYPGNLLLWLPISQAVTLSWTVVLHIILTGCLMYAFLRNRGASRAASAWVAVIYQFLPGILLRAETVGLFEAAAWLPGLYWALECAVNEAAGREKGCFGRWLGWTLFASFEVAMMLLAGSSQIAFYGMVGGFFYLAGLAAAGPHPGRRTAYGALTFLLTALFAAILSAVQLIPTSIFSALSYRVQEAGYDYYRIGTWLNFPRLASLFMFPAVKFPSDLLDYLSSLGYIGPLGFLLIAIALSKHRRHMNPILAPFILMFFGVLMSFGLNLVINQNLINFPIFGLFRALGRMILPTLVAFMALSAVGLDLLFEGIDDRWNRRAAVGGIVGALVAGIALLVWYFAYEGLPATGFQIIGFDVMGIGAVLIAVGLIGLFRTRKRGWLIGLLIAWMIFQLGAMWPVKSAMTMSMSSFNATLDKLALGGEIRPGDPNRPARVLVAIDRDVWDPLLERLAANPFPPGSEFPVPAFGNEISMRGLGVLDAYTPLVTERWFKAAHEYAASGLVDSKEASGRLRTILAITGTDAIVAPGDFTGGDGFEIVVADIEGAFPPGWHAVMTPPAVPYVSIPSYVEAWTGSDWELFKHWIVQEDYVPGQWVCIEMDDGASLPEGMRPAEIRRPVGDEAEIITTMEPLFPAWTAMEFDPGTAREIVRVDRDDTRISIETRTDSPCWVVIRESYMPGWEARVDESPVAIVPADYLFMAVPVPAGEHTIELEYATPGLKTGALISGIGWSAMLLVIILGVVVALRPGTGTPISSRDPVPTE